MATEVEDGWISLGVASDRVVSETTEDLTEELGVGWSATTTTYDDGGWSVSIDADDEPPTE